MIRWIPYSFVRTVLFFIAGIATALRYPDVFSFQTAVWIVITGGGLYVFLVKSPREWRRRFNPGWIGLPLVAVLGFMHLAGQTESRYPDHLVHHTGVITHYQAIVTGYPEERATSWRIEAQVLRIYDDHWSERRGRILLYLSKEFFKTPFAYGDLLVIKGAPQRPDPPANPAEFDYARYLEQRNIFHQHFVREGVMRMGAEPSNGVLALAYKLRARAEAVLRTYVPGERAQGIARALVLGVTDGLDNELREAYAGVGVMHILAVSGLHVGVIYFVLASLLRPLNRLPKGNWAVAVISIFVLWLYAFITGLSPSVLRAVTMFSFLTLAKPWRRGTNVYNTLAVSAFVMLLADPWLVCSVGFQLSYLAVLGIVYFYPRLIPLWEPTSRVGWEIWKASTVSFAAQVTTSPLGLLYFHQFPNYFLFGNLLVVPLSSIILMGGLLLLPLSLFPVLARIIGQGVSWMIEVLNTIVFFFERLPGSIIEGIYITAAQCFLLYALVVVVSLLFQSRRFRYVYWASVLVVIFAVLQWVHFNTSVYVEKMAVYRIAGFRAIDFIDKGRVYFLADSALIAARNKMDYHIAPHRMVSGVCRVEHELPMARKLRGCTWIRWKGKTILLIDAGDFEIIRPLKVDWVIIGRNAVRDPGIFATQNIACSKIILDSSNAFFYAARFVEEAKLHKLDVHSVLHEGAFVFEIETRDT